MNKTSMYLDHAAATPLDERVFAAMQPFFAEQFYNPSSPYAPAIEVRRAYGAAKQRIAEAIGAKSDELIMTAGATESINIIFHAAASGHVVVSAIEHAAVLGAARQAESMTMVAPDKKGQISAHDVSEAIRDNTTLVSISFANNELGTIQKLSEIAEIIRKTRFERQSNGNRTPLWFHTDASQGAGQIDINVARLGVDAMTLNAGKVYGPKQVGLLWVSRHVRLKPFIHGGGQESGVRSGTENVAGTVGFAEALVLAQEHRKSEAARLAKLRDQLQRELTEAFPEAVVSGHPQRRLAGHLHISFPDIDAERLIFALEARGVYVATGSACAANKGTRSHVLEAIGLAPSVADGSMRISLGRLNDEETIQQAAGIMKEVIGAEYKRSGQ